MCLVVDLASLYILLPMWRPALNSLVVSSHYVADIGKFFNELNCGFKKKITMGLPFFWKIITFEQVNKWGVTVYSIYFMTTIDLS